MLPFQGSVGSVRDMFSIMLALSEAGADVPMLFLLVNVKVDVMSKGSRKLWSARSDIVAVSSFISLVSCIIRGSLSRRASFICLYLIALYCSRLRRIRIGLVIEQQFMISSSFKPVTLE